jgi:ketosteroid isomerase-like protein
MRRFVAALVVSCPLIVAASCAPAAPASDTVLAELLTLERAALDRWLRFDPEGYLGIFAPDISYFDPTAERRVDGLDAMRKRLEPMKTIPPPFTDPRYEIIGPKVDHHGEMAVLSMNLVSYGRVGGQPESVLARWNSTEVYRRMGGQWRIVHSHWSRTQADVKPGA